MKPHFLVRPLRGRSVPLLTWGALILSTGWLSVACSAGAGPGGDGDDGGGSGGKGDVGGASTGGSTAEPGDTGGTDEDGTWVLLPIEVLGSGSPDEEVIAGREVPLAAEASAQDVTTLYVQCHRCGFYDSPEFEQVEKPITRVKASLRILGGAEDAPWVDVTPEAVTLDEVSRAHGGFDGGLLTTTFEVTLTAEDQARLLPSPGLNRIEFRFNGTDGNSNGYRILDLELRNAAGESVSAFTKRWADIVLEKAAPEASSEDIAAGQDLWHGHNLLRKSPLVATTLRAGCSSCHAEDGRDLQYFNYSNHSIIQRSRFHGLSDEEGAQIAAYLRSSLYEAVPHVAQAAPWNPPYQPGPGLDDKPIVEWAAGAGLDAVLDDGVQFLQAFVGQEVGGPFNVSQAELDAAHNSAHDPKMNVREMPVALQLPDWNAWLPIAHPLDIWTPEPGEDQGLFENKPDEQNPLRRFENAIAWLEENKNPNGVYGDWTHLTVEQQDTLASHLREIGNKTNDLAGGGRGTRESGNPENPFGGEVGGAKLQALMNEATRAQAQGTSTSGFSKQAFIERALFGLFHWMGVKQWEIAHKYGLEGPQATFHGRRDGDTWTPHRGVEERGWPFAWPSVFFLGPHMIYAPEQVGDVKREFYYSWETRLISYYRTNQWYQLQMTLNPMSGMDWPYHLGFTTGLADELVQAGEPDQIPATHLARFSQIRVKMAQLMNTDIPFNQPDPNDPDNLFKNTGMASKADILFKIGVAEITHRGPEDYQQTQFTRLDSLAPGLHLMFVNSALDMYVDYFGETTRDMYRLCDPEALMFGDSGEFEVHSGQRFCLDAERTPLLLNDDGEPYLQHNATQWTTEQHITWSALSAEQMGADPERVAALRDWLLSLYP